MRNPIAAADIVVGGEIRPRLQSAVGPAGVHCAYVPGGQAAIPGDSRLYGDKGWVGWVAGRLVRWGLKLQVQGGKYR